MSVVQESKVISPQINYKKYEQYAPLYKFVRVNMSNVFSSTITPTTNSQQIHFKLPYNTVFNLAKSRLNVNLTIRAQPAGQSSYMVADCYPFFGQVSLETGNGIQMLNLTDSSKYTKIMTKQQLKLSNYLTRTRGEMCYPSNDTINNTASTGGVAQSVAYLESKYLDISAAGTANNVEISYELGNFKNTVLAIDKDLTFGQSDVYLKMTIDNYDKWVYEATTVGGGGPQTLTNAFQAGNFDDVYLYLAVEQNPVLIDQIKQQFETQGINLLIDYPIITKQSSPASTSQNVVIPFTPAQGHHLKKIVHTVWNNTESLSTALDCDNTLGAKIDSYNTYIDSTKLQDDLVECSYVDAWRLNGKFCRDSAILNRSVYEKNWFHCDSFENPDMLKGDSGVSGENVVDGIAMDKGIQWQFLSTASGATAYQHLNIAIFQRNLKINRDGVQFV